MVHYTTSIIQFWLHTYYINNFWWCISVYNSFLLLISFVMTFSLINYNTTRFKKKKRKKKIWKILILFFFFGYDWCAGPVYYSLSYLLSLHPFNSIRPYPAIHRFTTQFVGFWQAIKSCPDINERFVFFKKRGKDYILGRQKFFCIGSRRTENSEHNKNIRNDESPRDFIFVPYFFLFFSSSFIYFHFLYFKKNKFWLLFFFNPNFYWYIIIFIIYS